MLQIKYLYLVLFNFHKMFMHSLSMPYGEAYRPIKVAHHTSREHTWQNTALESSLFLELWQRELQI